MSKEVGSRLRELRQNLKMTQRQLGEILGINGSAVAKYENGISILNASMLNLLASRFNVSMDYLVCGRGKLFDDDKDKTESSRFYIPSADKELSELFSFVSSISWVRHAVLSYFQKLIRENRELIEKDLKKEPGSKD